MKKILGRVAAGLTLAVCAWAIYSLFSASLPEPDPERSAEIRARLATGNSFRILALGDSITAGVNAPYSYLTQLETRLRQRFPAARIETTNAGVPGDTTEGGLRRVEHDVFPKDADVVLIEFGWNDLKNGISPERFARALEDLIDKVRQGTSAALFLMTTTEVDVMFANWKVRGRNKLIRQIAAEKDCGLIDLNRYFKVARSDGQKISDLMSSDHIHPSGMGQDLIAGAIFREWVGESP